MAVNKLDPKIIFASEAPAQDVPAVFANKTVGWGESRKNGGRPTIKQSNALQQETDLKILWLNENSVTPYDATIDYPVNAVTLKDGTFKIFNGSVWNIFLTKASVGLGKVDNTSDLNKPISTATQDALNGKADKTYVDTNLALKADLSVVKRGIGNIYDPTLIYNESERVILLNGDTAQSTISNNTNNPNTNMTGWILVGVKNPIADVDSIAELIAIQNPKEGQVVLVKSFLAGGMVGGGYVKLQSTSLGTDNVEVFNSPVAGKKWVRLNWKQPSIYDAGILADGSDETIKFQNLYSAATRNGLGVNLRKKTVIITKLDLLDFSHIYNGKLDLSSSSEFKTSPPRAPIMSSKINRSSDIDYEAQIAYSELDMLQDVNLTNVEFKSVSMCALIHKFKGLRLNNCVGRWEVTSMFKLVGGWIGTVLPNDTPASYNLVDPINGRCEDIEFNNMRWHGGYTRGELTHPVHFVACGDVTINGGSVDSVMGYRADIYNNNVVLNNVKYKNTNQRSIQDGIDGLANVDSIALYVGQNTYGVTVNGGSITDAIEKCIYVEAGSQIRINDLTVKNNNPLTGCVLMDIQSNYRNAENTKWGNCADITITGLKSNGTWVGIRAQAPSSVKSIKGLKIYNSEIITSANLNALVLSGVQDYAIDTLKTKGSILHGANNNNGYIRNSSIFNASNFALYVGIQFGGDLPRFENTTLITNTGSVIYNDGQITRKGYMNGGAIKSNSGASLIQNSASPMPIISTDFDFGGDKIYSVDSIVNLASGGKTVLAFANPYLKSGWKSNVVLHNATELFTLYGIDLSVKSTVSNGLLSLLVTNVGSSTVNFTATFDVELQSILTETYVN